MLADLPEHRRVQVASFDPDELALQANLRMAQGLLRRAQGAELALQGQARAVVRLLRLRGVLATAHPVSQGADGDRVRLLLPRPASGAEQRRFGGALAALVPLLPWCRRHRLQADVVLPGRGGVFVLRSGDPLPAGREPRRFDSALERTFARAFTRAVPAWELVREPQPVAIDGTLQFPDFLLRHRRDGRTVLLEIAAFWTPGYLQAKLRLLAQLGMRLLLCVEERAVGPDVDLPAGVLRFRRRLQPEAVLAALRR
jgi:uncharacterized protein